MGPVMAPPVSRIAVRGQPVPVRLRSDLVFAPRSADSCVRVTVKDPLSLQFFQFGLEEQFVLERLDGRTSAAEIQASFARRFAPQQLELEELIRFVGRVLQSGLAVRTGPAPAGDVPVRRAAAITSPWRAALSNPFAIR